MLMMAIANIAILSKFPLATFDRSEIILKPSDIDHYNVVGFIRGTK